MTKAAELVQAGAIGRVVQTVGLGPHRLNRETRPWWFWDCAQYGGVLTDIASHQIDQFLYFTGSTDAEIAHASVGNFANPDDPGLQDFGEIVLRSDQGTDISGSTGTRPMPCRPGRWPRHLGTEGTTKSANTSTLLGRRHRPSVSGQRNSLREDRLQRRGLSLLRAAGRRRARPTETAMSQAHCFKVCELGLMAQAMADKDAAQRPRGGGAGA